MISALEHFAENPIIDELVYLPHKTHRIKSVRAAASMFRRPFIEVEMDNGEVHHRHFSRDHFARDWAEAEVVLGTLTAIELISEFRYEPFGNPQKLVDEVLQARDNCIAEAEPMFDQGMYLQYLNQFGLDYKNLPAETEQRVAKARASLGTKG